VEDEDYKQYKMNLERDMAQEDQMIKILVTEEQEDSCDVKAQIMHMDANTSFGSEINSPEETDRVED
jgi:hypothetical protein